MNPSGHPDPALDRLLSGAADGLLDASEEKDLARRLENDPEARAHYLNYFALHGDLHWEYAEAASEPTPFPVSGRRSIFAARPSLPWILLAAALVLGLFLVPRFSDRPIVAVEFADHAVFDLGGASTPLVPGIELPAGSIAIESATGFAQFRFRDGSRFTVQGNSRLDFANTKGGKRLDLRSGRLSAEVNPQPEGRPLRVVTPSAEMTVLGTVFSVDATDERTSLGVEEGLVSFRRLSDGSSLEVPGRREVVASLDQEEALALREIGRPPSSWRLEPDRNEDQVSKGTAVTVQGVPCLEAKPYVAATREDGTKVVREGVALRADLALLEPNSVIRIRYRSDWGPIVFLGTSHPTGSFGGNYEYRLLSKQNPEGPDGWREAVIPLGEFEPVEKLAKRGFRPEGNTLTRIIVSVHDRNRLQVSELEVLPAAP